MEALPDLRWVAVARQRRRRSRPAALRAARAARVARGAGRSAGRARRGSVRTVRRPGWSPRESPPSWRSHQEPRRSANPRAEPSRAAGPAKGRTARTPRRRRLRSKVAGRRGRRGRHVQSRHRPRKVMTPGRDRGSLAAQASIARTPRCATPLSPRASPIGNVPLARSDTGPARRRGGIARRDSMTARPSSMAPEKRTANSV